MIYVSVQMAAPDRRPKPIFMRGETMSAILAKLAGRRSINLHPWYSVDVRTISEAEYNRHIHPRLEGF